MDKHSLFGKFNYFILPISIGLVWILGATLNTILLGALFGALVANVRAVLFIGEMNKVEENPLRKLQFEASGVTNDFKIKFIGFQTLAGAIVCVLYTALISGIALLFK